MRRRIACPRVRGQASPDAVRATKHPGESSFCRQGAVMIRNLVLGIAILLYGAGALVDRALATTVTLDPPATYAASDLEGLKGMLAGCCDNPDVTGSRGVNAGTNNIGFGN